MIKIGLSFLVICFFNLKQLPAQATWPLQPDSLLISLESLLNNDPLQSIPARREFHFLSEFWYKNVYSQDFLSELLLVLEKIEPPFDTGQLETIHAVEIFDATESYSMWILTLNDGSGKYYYYQYFNNSGPGKIPLAGTTNDGRNYVERMAGYLIGRNPEKNEDYLISAKIQDGRFVYFTGSQTVHRSDRIFFSDLLAVIAAIGD